MAAAASAADSRIAVIGMACRVPGADSVAAFWDNLVNGRESISFLSEEELRASGVAAELARDPRYVAAGGFLDGVDSFDAALFGITPREAALLDPQHRLLLECAWHGLEHAGYGAREPLARVGIFTGVANSAYFQQHVRPTVADTDPGGAYQALISGERDFAATRLSYQFNLSGPSVNVQTACSTSLVAVHMACQALLNGECDMALAGGAAVRLPQKAGHLHQGGMILSSDGHCRPFDAGASGTVAGNGAGFVVLKRLAEAVADGDLVHAVILGSAINNDGADKVGYTAPSVTGQAGVIVEAQELAGVAPETVGFLEAHGTGTALGDPIEVAALTSAFRRAGARGCGWCALGSVKSNVGHLDTAAGVVGLIKAVLAVQRHTIPPTLHFTRANPELQLAASPFRVPARTEAWPSDEPRRAGVSAFGIGGTNAHVVVEEAEPRPVSGLSRRWLVLPMSAQTPTALHTLGEEIADVLTGDTVPIADVAYTLAVGRKALGVRGAVVRDAHAGARSAGPRQADDGSRAEADDLARRWTAGEAIDWREHYAGESRHRVVLPTYPFERKPYWIDRPAAAPAAASREHERSSTRPDDWLYAPTWRRGGALATSTATGRWLILADTTGVGEGLARRLRSAGASVEILARDTAHAPDRSRYRALIDRARADNIVHLWTAGHAAAADRLAGFASVLALGQALAERGSCTNLTVVTSVGHTVTGDESLRPEHALLLGPVRVLPQEHPELRCRAIDIPEGPLTDKQQDLLFAECLQEEGPRLVAHRGPFRWLPGFDRWRVERPERPPPAAVYLITGGLGEMGLALARHLFDTTGARLVLTSRTPLPPPQTWQALVDSADVPVTLDLDDFDAPGSIDPATARRLRALVDLQARGADVLVLAADAADEPQMRAAFDRAEARFGRVDGVVHAAGLPAAQAFAPVEELDAAAAQRHFTPKVDGVEVLRTIVRERDVGACVLMSSLAGTLGGLGFAAYAAASAYLDAVAQQEDGRAGTRWLSIAWDAWRFDADDEAMRAGIARNLASTAIRPLEGAALFAHIIASGHAGHVLVSTTDLERRAGAWTGTRPARTAVDPGLSRASAKTGESRGPLTRVSRSDIEQVVAEIWQELLGVERLGLQDDFYDRGGDSLLATQVVSRLRGLYGIELPVRVLFDETTAAGLAAHIHRALGLREQPLSGGRTP